MSIATAITAAQGKVANAYTAVSTKGGTLPATQNLSNLPTAISSIPSGITPTGTLSITTNGVYNVTNYASADVSVSSGGGGGGTGTVNKLFCWTASRLGTHVYTFTETPAVGDLMIDDGYTQANPNVLVVESVNGSSYIDGARYLDGNILTFMRHTRDSSGDVDIIRTWME